MHPRHSSSNIWHDNEAAKQHFIDSFLNVDGFSLPYKNGKPMRKKVSKNDMKVPKYPLPTNKPKVLNIGTGDNKNLGIKTRKFRADVFASRYEPDVEIDDVKKDRETKLYQHTGTKHTVQVEKLNAKYSHYSSFKITCFCENTAGFMNSNI